ncbi:hypothetical protein EJB05_35946, partial [Eragrostis curvula]
MTWSKAASPMAAAERPVLGGRLLVTKRDIHRKAMDMLSQEGDGEHKDGLTTAIDTTSNGTLIKECISKTEDAIAISGPDRIINPDPTSKVPRKEVLECVSSILKSHGYCPTGEGICIDNLNLSPYEVPLPEGLIPDEHGYGLITKVAKEAPHPSAGKKKVVKKKIPIPKGWDLKYRRRSFFPYWRSVLVMKFPMKAIRYYCVDKQLSTDKAIRYCCIHRQSSYERPIWYCCIDALEGIKESMRCLARKLNKTMHTAWINTQE